MNARAALLSVCFIGGLSGSVLSACVACNDIACEGGFRWNGTSEGEEALPLGEYQIKIEAEDSVIRYTCDIEATLEATICAGPWLIEGEDVFTVRIDVLPSSDADAPDAAVGFEVSVVDYGDSDDDDNYREQRGPEEVTLTLEYGGALLIEESYSPDYVHNTNFWGDPRCGFCDELESRSETFTVSMGE